MGKKLNINVESKNIKTYKYNYIKSYIYKR